VRNGVFYRGTAQASPVRQNQPGFYHVPAGQVSGRDRRRTALRLRRRPARWAHLPYEFLDHVLRWILNEIPGISRVTYDILGKLPVTIEWEGPELAGNSRQLSVHCHVAG